MKPTSDLMFFDFRSEFEGNNDDQELALVSLDAVLRNPVHCRRRIAFLESLGRALARDALELCRGGLHRSYHDRGREISPAEVDLLDRLSRNPTALGEVHHRLRGETPIPLGHLPDAAVSRAESLGRRSLHRSLLTASLAAAVTLAIGSSLWAWQAATHRAEQERQAAEFRDVRDDAIRGRDAAEERATAAERRLAAAVDELAVKERAIAELRTEPLERQSRLRISPHADEGDGTRFRAIDLAFGDISPGLISKIDICRDFVDGAPNHWETVYYWRSRPLPLSYHLEYRHEPSQAPRPITTVVRYHLQALDDQRRQELDLGLDQRFIDRRIELESGPDGVAFRALPDATVIATASEATENGLVRLDLAGSSPSGPLAESTMLHVVVRAVDGSGPWVGDDARLLITDTGMSVADISGAARETSIDLKRIGLPERAEDRLPTRYEVLVVGLPGTFSRSQITEAELRAYQNLILSRTVVEWDNPPEFLN